MHGFHIATNWKKSCWNSASMTLRQELTHWNASKKLTRAYAHHILAYARGPYCHPLTKDEQGGFGRGSHVGHVKSLYLVIIGDNWRYIKSPNFANQNPKILKIIHYLPHKPNHKLLP